VTSLIRSRDIKEARRRLRKSEASSGASSVLVALNNASILIEERPIIPEDFLAGPDEAGVSAENLAAVGPRQSHLRQRLPCFELNLLVTQCFDRI
jgi:hypothetical protein